VEGVHKIAVLRANALGDFLVSLPALQALRQTYPEAEIVLLGRRWHAELLAGRPGPVDRVVELPPVRGVSEPGDAEAPAQPPPDFLRAMRQERFDLAVQMHGGGAASNPFVRQLGARVTVGFRTRGAEPLDLWTPYVFYQHEVVRFLMLAALVGAAPATLEPALTVVERDLAEARAVLPDHADSLVTLHPGATDVRRRWPVDKFVRLGDLLQDRGWRVALTGVGAERPVTSEIAGRLRRPPVDLTGRLSLGGLAGVLSRSRLVAGNDTGPLHLARAVGTPTATVIWVGNFINAGPLNRDRHRALVSWTLDCPVCGVRNVDVRCPHDVSFVQEVLLEDVLEECLDLLCTGGGTDEA
jgi:ADP-heptose:LPS heptosyltransferase